ncbi:hypothetical protein GCM10009548_76900 [Streptomyces malaysiensis subsp. malaysiensis]
MPGFALLEEESPAALLPQAVSTSGSRVAAASAEGRRGRDMRVVLTGSGRRGTAGRAASLSTAGESPHPGK